MSKRIYKVTTPGGENFVEATSQSQAISICIAGQVQCEVAGSSDVASHLEKGGKIIRTEEKPAAEKTPAPQPQAAPVNAGTAAAGQAGDTPRPVTPAPQADTSGAPAPQNTTPAA